MSTPPIPTATAVNTTDKFISKDGVLMRNPNYINPNNPTKAAKTVPGSIDFPSTQGDLELAKDLTEANGHTFEIPVATAVALEAATDPDTIDLFQCKVDLDGQKILDALTAELSRYEVPIGLLNKLLVLKDYALDFLIDDSGSMGQDTDSMRGDFAKWMKDNYPLKTGTMTRWEEVEDRCHTMVDVLANVPVKSIKVIFMNRPDTLIFGRDGSTPEEWRANAHRRLREVFARPPAGTTPTAEILLRSFDSTDGVKTIHYLFTDGVPNDVGKAKAAVAGRRNPSNDPVCLIACTDNDSDTEWMSGLDEQYPSVAEIDDFRDESAQVMAKQGPLFPYSYGLWLISLIVAAINPNDLDILDEDRPLTKYSFDSLLGRCTMEGEYRKYFDAAPAAKAYRSKYNQYATVQAMMVR